MDYSALKQAIVNYTGRQQLLDQTATFIALAEAKLRKKIFSDEVTTVNLTVSANSDTVDLPSDFYSIFSEPFYEKSGSIIQLCLKSNSDINKERLYAETGDAFYYNIEGKKLRIAPKFSSDTAITLKYYSTIPSLSDTNTSNFLLANHSDIYLQASLIEAYIYTSDERNQIKYQNLLERSLSDYNYCQVTKSLSSTELKSDYTV